MAYLRFFSALREVIISIAIGGGYVSLFLVTFLEGIPLIGILIPGHVAIIGAGFLVAVGVFNPWVVIVITIVGAILGDFLSFYLGRLFGWPLIDRLRRFFFVKDLHIEKAKRLLQEHTGKALIIGRFNPVTRGIMPFLVGANRAPAGSFWIWNGIGAAAWVVSSVALGWGIGLGYHLAAGFMGQMVVVALIAGLLIAWGYRFVNIRFHIFRRYDLFALGLNLIALFSLARMIQDRLLDPAKSFMIGFDYWVNGIMARFAPVAAASSYPRIIEIASWTSALGGITAVSIVTVIMGIALSLWHRWRSAAILLLSVGSTALSVGWIKGIFMLSSRPDNLVIPPAAHGSLSFLFDQASLVTDPSFPSAHAAFAAAFFVVVAYLFTYKIRHWVWRELFVVVCVILIAAIGMSRLVLNVHWASDVIAGWSLGVFCATASILLVRYVGALLYEKVGN